MPELLTEGQRRKLDENGWVRLPGVVSPPELAAVCADLDQVTANFLYEGRDKVLGLPILTAELGDGRSVISRLGYASYYVPRVRELVHDQRFDGVRRLIAPNAVLAERCRMGVIYNDLRGAPGASSQMGWHTDGHKLLIRGRWPIQNLQVCLHLDDAPQELGGVRVLPGTHTQGLWGLLFRKLLFVDKRPDPAEVALSANAGDVTIYDGRLWHRTDPGSVVGSRRRQLWLKYLQVAEPDRNENSSASLFLKAQGLDG
jgi:hypothetical protein